jgi:cytidylate kinase
MFNVVTIAREYGSGGADIGRKVAELLEWDCVDKQIIERVAAMGKVNAAWAASADEHVIAWWARILKSFRKGGPELYVGDASELCVDHDTLQHFTAHVIQESANVGGCVLIGRSSGCLLRHNPRVFRVFVYAPFSEKIKRMKLRHPDEKDLPALLSRMDSERIHYAQTYYGCDPSYRGIYHLCVNSTLGIDECARMIVQSVKSFS